MPFITSTPAPIRLAILETDEPIPSIQAKCRRFGTIFTSLLRAACETLDPPQTLDSQLALSTHDVVASDLDTVYPDPATIDAVLITGSRYSAFGDEDWIVRPVTYIYGAYSRVAAFVSLAFASATRLLPALWVLRLLARRGGWELAVYARLDLPEEGKLVFRAESLVKSISP